MKNKSTRAVCITVVLSGMMMSFGFCETASDYLAEHSGPIMDSLTKPQYPFESRQEKAARKLEEEARNSFKIVVVNACAWKLADGSSVTVRPGDVLVAKGSKENSYIVSHRNTDLLVPFGDARQTPFTEQEVAARRREIQQMYSSSAQIQELREQNQILDEIQTRLRTLR